MDCVQDDKAKKGVSMKITADREEKYLLCQHGDVGTTSIISIIAWDKFKKKNNE